MSKCNEKANFMTECSKRTSSRQDQKDIPDFFLNPGIWEALCEFINDPEEGLRKQRERIEAHPTLRQIINENSLIVSNLDWFQKTAGPHYAV